MPSTAATSAGVRACASSSTTGAVMTIPTVAFPGGRESGFPDGCMRVFAEVDVLRRCEASGVLRSRQGELGPGEPHNTRRKAGRTLAGRYLPDLVYGANDGVITTFAVVCGVVGAALSNQVILILGFANLVRRRLFNGSEQLPFTPVIRGGFSEG